MAIQWVQETWKEVTGTPIKNCFEKYGLVKSNDDLIEVKKVCHPQYVIHRVCLFRRGHPNI